MRAQVTHTVTIRHQPGDSNVLIRKMNCTGLLPGDEESVIGDVDVSIQLVSSEGIVRFAENQRLGAYLFIAAIVFKNKIMEMRLELFVMSLSEPRHDERLALKL